LKPSDAVTLIAGAVPPDVGAWADVGAGQGTFTRALAELLGPHSRIYAVDRDARAVAALERWAAKEASNVIPVAADFTGPFDLPGLAEPGLDGMLLANTLHFALDADVVLRRLRRAASRWVPYPVPPARLTVLAAFAGLSGPVITATRPSAFGGTLYVATSERRSPSHS